MNWEQSVEQLRKSENQKQFVKDCYFDDPLIGAAERFHKSSEWKAVQKILPKRKGRILDIGAGRGISSYAFAKDGWGVTALEPDPSSIVGAGAIRQLAAESELEIDVVEKWGEYLPFGDQEFDLVYMRQALHHARDLSGFCREAGRVLKSGGLFIATREHVISKKEDLAFFLNEHPLHGYYGGENAFVLEEYIQAIRNGGMELVSVLGPLDSDINLFPYSLADWRIKTLKLLEAVYKLVPKIFFFWKRNIFENPGRLYSFIARKV